MILIIVLFPALKATERLPGRVRELARVCGWTCSSVRQGCRQRSPFVSRPRLDGIGLTERFRRLSARVSWPRGRRAARWPRARRRPASRLSRLTGTKRALPVREAYFLSLAASADSAAAPAETAVRFSFDFVVLFQSYYLLFVIRFFLCSILFLILSCNKFYIFLYGTLVTFTWKFANNYYKFLHNFQNYWLLS